MKFTEKIILFSLLVGSLTIAATPAKPATVTQLPAATSTGSAKSATLTQLPPLVEAAIAGNHETVALLVPTTDAAAKENALIQAIEHKKAQVTQALMPHVTLTPELTKKIAPVFYAQLTKVLAGKSPSAEDRKAIVNLTVIWGLLNESNPEIATQFSEGQFHVLDSQSQNYTKKCQQAVCGAGNDDECIMAIAIRALIARIAITRIVHPLVVNSRTVNTTNTSTTDFIPECGYYKGRESEYYRPRWKD